MVLKGLKRLTLALGAGDGAAAAAAMRLHLTSAKSVLLELIQKA
jgi:DNA-binding GntR family transcriptional regulator